MDTIQFCNYAPSCIDTWEIFAKAQQHLAVYKNPACFVSGGADSDVMLDIIYHADDEKKVHYVYFDTGLEMEATKRHIRYLEEKYRINIEIIRPDVPIPMAVKKYGMPMFNKRVAEMIHRLQRNSFDFVERSFEDDLRLYPNLKAALRWLHGEYDGSQLSINTLKGLKEYLYAIGAPDVPVSQACCTYAKKDLSKKYCKQNDVDLKIIGIRKAEGGQRASIKSCFSECNYKGCAEFRPLFWMSNKEREMYEKDTGIIHSDAYTVYGCKRTGCAGCPFGKNWEAELKMLEKYEPKLYKAANSIFGEAYDYMRKYYAFREELSNKDKQFKQLSLFD